MYAKVHDSTSWYYIWVIMQQNGHRTLLSQRHTWRFYTTIAAIGENRQMYLVQRLRFSPIARIKSPAFAKCSRSLEFLCILLRIQPIRLGDLSDELSKLLHGRDRRKNSPAKIFAGDQIRRDRRIKLPVVSLALEFELIKKCWYVL